MVKNGQVLILSEKAVAYAAAVEAALPSIPMIVATNKADALRHGAACAIVLGDPPLLAQVIDELPAVRWVQSAYAGVDKLIAGSRRRDYQLTNVRNIFGPPMAEYVFCYLLMHARHGWARYDAQRMGRWDATPADPIRGKIIGLLGVGSIGGYIAQVARSFGMTTYGCTRGSVGSRAIDRYYHVDELVAFAAAVDFLVCSLPATPQTRHLVGTEVFAAMQAHALFINVGRGAVVDEDALADALRRRAIAGAVLDVLDHEPLPAQHPFWQLPNVIITGHTAALSYAEDVVPIFVDNYRRYVSGKPLLYGVNFELGY